MTDFDQRGCSVQTSVGGFNNGGLVSGGIRLLKFALGEGKLHRLYAPGNEVRLAAKS